MIPVLLWSLVKTKNHLIVRFTIGQRKSIYRSNQRGSSYPSVSADCPMYRQRKLRRQAVTTSKRDRERACIRDYTTNRVSRLETAMAELGTCRAYTYRIHFSLCFASLC